MTNSDSVANFDMVKSGSAVSSDCSMSLLISVILFDEMDIVSSNNNGVLHLCGNHNTLEDLSSNANIACERALFIYISSTNGLLRSFETKTNVLVVSNAGFSSTLDELSVLEETSLLFICFLSLRVSEDLLDQPFLINGNC